MNTSKKALCLNSDLIEQATQTLRVYKHRNRYNIIDRLLGHGPMSSSEIASFLNLEELYISEQLEILCDNDLVSAIYSDGSMIFSANEARLLQIREIVRNFTLESTS